MPAKELTNKEQKFAKVAASGATQAAAYAAAYSDKGSAATQRANGHRIAKKLHVAAEIKRLRRLPAVDDYTGIKKQMIERLLEIAENGKNSVAQHRAIVTLIRYADEGAERRRAKDPVPSIEDLVRELTANVEGESPEDRITDVESIGHGESQSTLPFQERSLEDDYGDVLDKPQLARPVSAAEAKVEAFRVAREEEIKAHQAAVRRNREEVQRLTELYRQQQETAASPMSEPAKEVGAVSEEAQDAECASTAVPRPYLQAAGPRPGFRREMIPGRFPPQFRWVPDLEGDEA
jgi:hypothetical protein